MSSDHTFTARLNARAISVAYRTETGVRDWFARRARRHGWNPAVLPYSGYSSLGTARVLARVVLAPPSFDLNARQGMRGWRHLLSLECPHTEVEITLGDTTVVATSDESGLVDQLIAMDAPLAPGTTHAHLVLPDRDPVPASVHSISSGPVRGVICDIDDTAWVTGLAHPFRAAWRTLRGTSGSRQSVPGMPALVRTALGVEPDPALMYLSNGPWNFVGAVTHFLELQKFPAGALLMTDWGVTPTTWFRDGRLHKESSITRLMTDLPHVTWVLIGDDGENDPEIYMAAAKEHPGRVAAIVLRRAGLKRVGEDQESVHGVPVIRGDDGDELLPRLLTVLPDGGATSD
ncbi:phosphatase domain-containing protein [Demequina aestuarii]|uniref:phosphatase domain-containing protein n=1 Tax=Demequina aestuarii TaxID=327095 RepID=UPI0007860B75|nr:phosphatase domain-containing protein [Demequina aestuarii]